MKSIKYIALVMSMLMVGGTMEAAAPKKSAAKAKTSKKKWMCKKATEAWPKFDKKKDSSKITNAKKVQCAKCETWRKDCCEHKKTQQECKEVFKACKKCAQDKAKKISKTSKSKSKSSR